MLELRSVAGRFALQCTHRATGARLSRSGRVTAYPSVLGIPLTRVGSIPCGWAAAQSSKRSPGVCLLAHGALPQCPAARSTQKGPFALAWLWQADGGF